MESPRTRRAVLPPDGPTTSLSVLKPIESVYTVTPKETAATFFAFPLLSPKEWSMNRDRLLPGGRISENSLQASSAPAQATHVTSNPKTAAAIQEKDVRTAPISRESEFLLI